MKCLRVVGIGVGMKQVGRRRARYIVVVSERTKAVSVAAREYLRVLVAQLRTSCVPLNLLS